jgi:hypothetical protein
MTCRADGFPTPKIIWRREDGQSITVERKKKVMVYDGEVLHLTKLSRNEVRALNFCYQRVSAKFNNFKLFGKRLNGLECA